MLGLAFTGLFMTCEWANYWVYTERASEQKRRLVQLTFVALATVLASAVNPGFLEHWLYPFQVIGLESTKYIAEWQSPNLQEGVGRAYLIFVISFFASYTYMARKPDFTEFIIPVFFMFLGFISIRHVPIAVLALIPFIAIALSQGAATKLSTLWYRTRLKQLYIKWIGGGKQLGEGEYLLNWLLLLAMPFGFLVYYPIYHAKDEEIVNATLPVKAAEFIANAGITGKMFNTYGFGGYLIYRFYPTQKVFIDGRADMYGDAFFMEHLKIIGVKSGWEQAFNKYQIDYVITGRDEPLKQLLQARGDFKLVYEDKYNSVILRNEPRYTNIIAKYGR